MTKLGIWAIVIAGAFISGILFTTPITFAQDPQPPNLPNLDWGPAADIEIIILQDEPCVQDPFFGPIGWCPGERSGNYMMIIPNLEIDDVVVMTVFEPTAFFGGCVPTIVDDFGTIFLHANCVDARVGATLNIAIIRQ